MRVLLTRPRADSDSTAALLAARGIETIIEPLLTIEFMAEARVDVSDAQALLVTSGNGARALAQATGGRDLPVLAVGRASAEVARQLGFKHVEAAAGDVEALAALVRRTCDPAAGWLVHAAGGVVAGDLDGALVPAGFKVRRAVLYNAHPADAFSPSTRRALASHTIDAALFYSPRTAQTFTRLVGAADLEAACAAIDALCLSAAVATAIADLRFRHVRVPARPEQDALLALLDGSV